MFDLLFALLDLIKDVSMLFVYILAFILSSILSLLVTVLIMTIGFYIVKFILLGLIEVVGFIDDLLYCEPRNVKEES